MTKKLSFIFFLALTAACFVACSDQIKIENNLTKDQGRWKIDEYNISVTYDTITTSVSYDDVGEMIFYTTANGVWIQYDTTLLVKVARYFEWENTENLLTFQFDDIPVDSPETVFDIVNTVYDSIHLQLVENYDSIGLPVVKTTDVFLQRADELTHL